MTVFEKALAEYRTALEAASASATTGRETEVYKIHENGLKLIERQYERTQSIADCRELVEDAQFVHDFDGLRGDAVLKIRAAFERLVRVVSG